jgi:hypothetical protein
MGPLTPNDLPVHAKHYKDGYPLCWPLDKNGTFEGSWDEKDVTCKDCIQYMKEV